MQSVADGNDVDAIDAAIMAAQETTIRANTEAGSSLAWIAARDFGVVVAWLCSLISMLCAPLQYIQEPTLP